MSKGWIVLTDMTPVKPDGWGRIPTLIAPSGRPTIRDEMLRNTCKYPVPLLALQLSLGLVPLAGRSADVTGYALLATDYVFRGVTYSDSHGAAQIGADVALDNGLYLGAWGSTVDISNGPSRQRDLEVTYYLGYRLELTRRWSVGANAVAYSYPGAESNIDYDYVEYSLNLNLDDRVWLDYAYSPDLYHSGQATHHVAAYAEWPLGLGINLGAGLGYYDVSRLTGEDYTHWQIGMTRTFGRVDLDLRYHDASDWVPIISTPDRAEQRVVLGARLQF